MRIALAVLLAATFASGALGHYAAAEIRAAGRRGRATPATTPPATRWPRPAARAAPVPPPGSGMVTVVEECGCVRFWRRAGGQRCDPHGRQHERALWERHMSRETGL